MSNNYKNSLQEYFQKNNLPLPNYETKKIGEDRQSNLILWQSTLKLTLGNNKKIFKSKSFPNKKDAEMYVAEQGLKYIEKDETQNDNNNEIKYCKSLCKYSFNEDDILIIIDLDNIQKIDSLEHEIKDFSNIHLFGFIGKLTNPCKNNGIIKIIKANDTSKDSADIKLTLEMGKLINKLNRKHIMINCYIVTRDHFGECLTNTIKEETCINEARNFIDISEIKKYLNKLN
jgi:hypothetical protein